MRGIKQYLKPKNLDEALQMLDEHRDNAIILAGGTHLALVKSSESEVIIDIKSAMLNYIKQDDDYVRLGSATRPVDILNSKLLTSFAGGILADASSKIGSILTQNLVTVGGNVYSLFPWSNLPVALLVLGALVEISSVKGKRIMKIKDFLSGNPRKQVANNELISEILIPQSSKGFKTSYKTFSLTENDYDMVIAAVSLDMDNKTCRKAKIALGAAISPPDTICEAGKVLQDRELTLELIEEASDKVISSITLLGDFRTTDEHRLAVVKTLVKRALEDCRS